MVTATYNGDGDFLTSTDSLTQTVLKAQTSTLLTSSQNPSQSGQSVSFTATVSPVAPGAGTPTGSVVLDFGDGNVSAPVALVGGVATTTHAYATTSGSPFTVVATYSGDGNFTASSGAGGHTVDQATTTASVTSTPNPSTEGEGVSVTATLTANSPGAGTPTGTVTFDFGDGSPTVTQTLAGGTVTTTHTYTNAAGSPYTITAAYGGDTDFAGDTATDTQVVVAGA